MHATYWGLTRSPFSVQLNPADYYPSVIHEEALARLQFLVESGRRLGYLTGAGGTGKSLVLEIVARQLRRANSHVVKMNAVGLASNEFVWKLAGALGHALPASAAPFECWREVSDHLVANRYQRMATIVLLDDADEMTVDLQSALCRLAIADGHPDTRLTLILTGQPQRTGRFGAKLNEICDLRTELEPWDARETAQFIRSSLQLVGGDDAIFSDAGIDHLFHRTSGIPRRIRQLAELALLAGAAEELEEIDEEVIESVHKGLTNTGINEAA